MKACHCITVSLVLVACLTLAAAADELVTKSGRKYVGKIVKETKTEVHIKTKFGGIMKVKRSEIASLERIKSKADEYKERLAKIGPRDMAAHWELALWCRVENLGSLYTKQLKRIIALDPNHEKARKALGHVRYKNRWVTKRELKKLEKKALEEEMKAKGMVKYRGKWVTQEGLERMKKGLVKHEGRWVTKEEKKKLEKGLVQYKGEWVTRKEMENREKGLYRVGRNWVTEKEANEFHSDWDTAWVLKGTGYEITSNAPIAYLNKQKEIISDTLKAMKKFSLDRKPDGDIAIHIYKTIGELNQVQETVQTEGFPSNMYYSLHSGSIGGAFKFTDPPFVATFKFDTKFYQHLFLGHGIGEGYLWYLIGLDKVIDLWFLLGPGHYFGFTQTGKVQFNVNHVNEMVRSNYLSVGILIATRELSDNTTWNERFFYQSAALIYMLLKDPRYAEKFKACREDIFKSGEATKTIRKHFDIEELDRSLRALLKSARPIPNEVKEP